MGARDGFSHADKFDIGSFQNISPDGGVLLHYLPLLGVQFTGLRQNLIGYSDFTDIMHGGGFFMAGLLVMASRVFMISLGSNKINDHF
jgi:hypothetical protein